MRTQYKQQETIKDFLSIDHTCARRTYSRINGFAGCSNESNNNVSGDTVSRRLSNFDINSKLCVRRCEILLFSDGIFISQQFV
jgi:hypothetical protein